jgi:hypothetical protein
VKPWGGLEGNKGGTANEGCPKRKLKSMPSAVFLIPIVAIVMSMSIPIVAIVANTRKRRAIYELYHRERLAAIEKGVEPPPLPPDLQCESSVPKGGGTYLLKGLIWLAVGIGIFVSLRTITDEDGTHLLGYIPGGIGIAYLIYYAVEGRKLPTPGLSKDATRPVSGVS